MEALLPQVAFPTPPIVYPSRVLTMNGAKHPCQAVLVLWHDDKVNVIWHEAICPYRYTRFSLGLCQLFQVGVIVTVVEKRFHSAVAALRDVVWVAWNHKARHPWHGESALAQWE